MKFSIKNLYFSASCPTRQSRVLLFCPVPFRKKQFIGENVHKTLVNLMAVVLFHFQKIMWVIETHDSIP